MLDLNQFRAVLASPELRAQHGLDLPQGHLDILLDDEAQLDALFQRWTAAGQPRYSPPAEAAPTPETPVARATPVEPVAPVEPVEPGAAAEPAPEPLVAPTADEPAVDEPAVDEPAATPSSRRGTAPTIAGVLLVLIAAFLGLIGIAITASPSFVIIPGVILVVGLITLVLGAVMLRRNS